MVDKDSVTGGYIITRSQQFNLLIRSRVSYPARVRGLKLVC